MRSGRGFERRRRIAVIAAVGAILGLLGPGAATGMGLTRFSTPSRNIGCVVAATYVRCDIRVTTAPKPRRPATCELDYGDALEMGPATRARRICHGDTALGGPRVLGYGRSLVAGPFSCTSRVTGLSCRNRAGHGWLLSRSAIRLF